MFPEFFLDAAQTDDERERKSVLTGQLPALY